ncbi:MAG: hypothetical protein ABF747_09300 [Bifidobacterium sp.]|uniref:Uncharacterized protein n=1 Tax=Bifidobacterium fermentum TaxID=3059035 RepID=A0AB39U9L4_9BIFI
MSMISGTHFPSLQETHEIHEVAHAYPICRASARQNFPLTNLVEQTIQFGLAPYNNDLLVNPVHQKPVTPGHAAA